jgi:hypothetical protein
MPSVRRRGLVGLIALVLITAAQAGPASPASADASRSTADRTTRVDIVLRTPASIGGTLTLPGGAPAVLAPVDVHRATGDGRLEASGFTDAAGRYDLGGLEPGFYVVRFGTPNGAPRQYVPEWSGDTTRRALAERIVVTRWGQEVTDVDAMLAPAP